MIMKKVCIFLIKLYKGIFSPFLGNQCRFYPTCSEYTKQAIEKYGALRGCIKGLKRIIRCNPFCKGGYDPLL